MIRNKGKRPKDGWLVVLVIIAAIVYLFGLAIDYWPRVPPYVPRDQR